MSKPIPIQILAAIGFVLVTFTAPALGIISPPGEWYQGINKPSWNPPAWIFGPVWTALYLMMAAAAWLVWREEKSKKALVAYFVQLIFNAAWSPLFFGFKRIDWACADIVALWFAILVTILSFWKVRRLAACLMVPYLGWVSFATLLNAALWAMNRL